MTTQRERNAQQAGRILYNSFSDNGSTRSATSWEGLPDASVESSCCSVCRRPKVSPIRRTFCLFVVFDLVFSVILWIIYKKISGSQTLDITTDDFCFRKALFDTVLVSAGRFLVLISSYSLFMSQKPWAVAVTTFATCVFLVVKAILYQWGADNSVTTIDVCMLVVTFIVAWVETWLLDFKVLPWEEKRRTRALESLLERAGYDQPQEDRRLLANGSPRIYGPTGQRPLSSHTPMTDGGADNYYSPLESARVSPYGSPPPERFLSVPPSTRTSRGHSLVVQDESFLRYTQAGEQALLTAWQLLSEPVSLDGATAPDGWELEHSGSNGGGCCVFSKRVPKQGKVFRMSATIDTSAKNVFSVIVDECESTPEWNPTLMDVRVLLTVGDNTMVVYNVAAAAAGGVVSSRDFVYVMHYVQKDGWYVSAYVSTLYPTMPPQKGHVRGEQRPGLTRMRDIGPNKCHIESLLDTDLKGWLPQYLIDQAMSSVMLDYLKHLKARCTAHTNGPVRAK